MSAPLSKASKSGNAMNLDMTPILLAEPQPSDADSLTSRNNPDDLANEQTWPADDEMHDVQSVNETSDIPDANQGTTPRRIRRVPKGMSEYQAAWIVEDDTESEDEDHEAAAGEEVQEDGTEGDEMLDMSVDDEIESRKAPDFQDLDMEEENRQSVASSVE